MTKRERLPVRDERQNIEDKALNDAVRVGESQEKTGEVDDGIVEKEKGRAVIARGPD
jgi:hypothetical protein